MSDLRDIGVRTGTLLIFGGPYSNLQALVAVRDRAQQLGIPPENCICTGDIVAYCGQPQDTVALLQDWGAQSIMGNCEESLAFDAPDCGCGFTEGSSCDLLSVRWFQFAQSQISHAEKAWFAQLPQHMTLSLDGVSMLVVHGSLTSINQFIFQSSDVHLLQAQLEHTDAQVILAGHSGIPFTKQLGNRVWHNAGVIGMPANDGTPRTWFSLVHVEAGDVVIETCALDYQYQQTSTIMDERGLAGGYADALLSGLWPSTDILPVAEQSQTGMPLHSSLFTITSL